MAKRITKKLQEFVEQLCITLFVINHTTKSSCKEIQTHSSMRASGLYSSEADFLIAVSRTQYNYRYSKLVFSRHDSDDDEIVTEFELSKNRLVEYKDRVSEVALLKQEDGRTDDSNEKIILEEMEAIIKAKNKNEVETNELSHLFDGEEVKMVKKTFHNAINKLVLKGKIEKLKKGTYAI